ncbi:LytTR family DNA-binding domain-containing protein [Flavobacteriaceae sp. LMIT009]
MNINCIIVDDEPSSQIVIKTFANDVDFLDVVEICNNALEANSVLNKRNDIDLIFLDINMPKLSGLDFYKSLQNPPDVIFTTAYSQYALEGFEVNAIDYLLKPFSFERFLKAVNKVIEKRNNLNSIQEEHLVIKANKVIHKVAIQDILFIEAFGDYVKVHLGEKMIITNSTFTNILKQLPQQFVRCHKSFAINLKKMNSLAGNVISIENKSVPVGLKYKPDLLEALN